MHSMREEPQSNYKGNRGGEHAGHLCRYRVCSEGPEKNPGGGEVSQELQTFERLHKDGMEKQVLYDD